MTSFFLCCPWDRIDWTSPTSKNRGLICCNTPWDNTANQFVFNWYTEGENDAIIIPIQQVLFPFWLACLPCFWIHMCLLLPIGKAKAWIVYQENQSIVLESRIKYCCFEVQEFKRKNVSEAIARFETRSGIFKNWEESLLEIKSDLVSDNTEWIKVHSASNDRKQRMQQLAAAINKKVQDIEVRSDNGQNTSLSYPVGEIPLVEATIMRDDNSDYHFIDSKTPSAPAFTSNIVNSNSKKNFDLPANNIVQGRVAVRQMTVTVPAGTVPGSKISTMSPEGLIVEVQVPEFSKPGMDITVQY